MGEVNHFVDHLKLEYKGILVIKDLIGGMGHWLKESPYEKGGDYISEQHLPEGKCIEHIWWPWKKADFFCRHFMKIRILIYNSRKVDVMVEGKKRTMDHAKVLIYIDGFVEWDYDDWWSGTPLLQFIRTLYTKFFHRNYSKFYEQVVVRDCHGLYEYVERMLGTYKSYRPITKVPHFHY